MLVRTARITVVIAWVLVLGVVAYLATHTRVTAPFLSRLVSRHFLQQVDGRLRLGDYRLRPLHGVDLYGVAITLRTRGGGLTVINVDTLEIDFKLTEVIGRAKRLRRLELIDTSVYMLLGAQETERPSRDWSELRFPDVRLDQVVISGGFSMDNLKFVLLKALAPRRNLSMKAASSGEMVFNSSANLSRSCVTSKKRSAAGLKKRPYVVISRYCSA